MKVTFVKKERRYDVHVERDRATELSLLTPLRFAALSGSQIRHARSTG